MKSKLLIAVLFLLLAGQSVQAQRRNPQIRNGMMQRVKAAKWAFLVSRLNLDEQRAGRLQPVYEAYEAEKKAIVREARQARQGVGEITDEEAEKLMNTRLETAGKILSLKQKYKTEFLKVISPTELLTLQDAEQEFALKIQAERQKRRGSK